MLCLKPLEKGLFFSFKSLHMDPLSLGGLSLKAQKTLYFVASDPVMIISDADCTYESTAFSSK